MKKIIFIILMLFATMVMAGEKSLEFTWDQDIPGDMGGWKLYQSTTTMADCKTGVMVLDIPYTGQTEYTATHSLSSPDGQTVAYFWQLTAYDVSGNESGCSNEVTKTIDFKSPGVPISLDVIIVAE